jgi:uncharacterized protein (DUF2235 family)
MPKNIVICCDGTGNEINTTLSNVLKLYRVLVRDEGQRVYYHPGVGTIGLQSTWRRLKQETYGVLGLATGAGLDEDTLAASQENFWMKLGTSAASPADIISRSSLSGCGIRWPR